jgi:hypothetical protein
VLDQSVVERSADGISEHQSAVEPAALSAAERELARLGSIASVALGRLMQRVIGVYEQARASAGAGWQLVDAELAALRADVAAVMREGFYNNRHWAANPTRAAELMLAAEERWRSYVADPREVQTRGRIAELRTGAAVAAPAIPDAVVRLVAMLAARGVVLVIEGEKFRASNPRQLNETDRRLIRENRAALRHLLQESELV